VTRRVIGVGAHPTPSADLQDDKPELADVGRLARRLIARTVAAARAEDESASRLLSDHLGTAGQAAALPVAKGSWPAYDV
jgi:hypothetical protein